MPAYPTQMVSPAASLPTSTSTSAISGNAAKNPALSSGAMIGISLGAILAVVFIVGFFIGRYLSSRAKRRQPYVLGESTSNDPRSDEAAVFELVGKEMHEMGDERAHSARTSPVQGLENAQGPTRRLLLSLRCIQPFPAVRLLNWAHLIVGPQSLVQVSPNRPLRGMHHLLLQKWMRIRYKHHHRNTEMWL